MDWQLTCRVCLETGDMVSLFDWDENNEQLADKYAFCCGVEVLKNDTLPTLICLACVDKLTESYQFKQQCLSSVETLRECLEEFLKTSGEQSNETELITIKNEEGGLIQYELPVENTPTPYTRTISKRANKEVVTNAPPPLKRGRPRKYPDNKGTIHASPYTRKQPKPSNKQSQSITQLIEGATFKEEPDDQDEEEGASDVDDPDFAPDGDGAAVDDDHEWAGDQEAAAPKAKKTTPSSRGRPRKQAQKVKHEDGDEMDAETEDMLLKETILAMSEPIPDHVINPKPKKPRKPQQGGNKKLRVEKIHTCETCGSSFTSNASLQAHIRRHLGIKPYVCSICGYSCVLNMELRRHMFRHTGQRPYPCRICDRRFADFGSRQKHESICGFSCAASDALKRHMYRHTGEKPYKCRVCERAFSDYGTRQKHERLHMGLRPYTCSVCGKSFTYSYVLANHMLIHTGEKKYSCAPCNRKFTKAHHLKYHNKVHHKQLYAKMVEEAEAKKRGQQNIKLSELFTGTILDGKLTIVNDQNEAKSPTDWTIATDGENEGMMHVVEITQEQMQEDEDVENDDDPDERETDRAVASMQAVELSEEYIM